MFRFCLARSRFSLGDKLPVSPIVVEGVTVERPDRYLRGVDTMDGRKEDTGIHRVVEHMTVMVMVK